MTLEPRTALAVVGSSAGGFAAPCANPAESLGTPRGDGWTRKIGNCATPPPPRRTPYRLPRAPVPTVPALEDRGDASARRERYALRAAARHLYPPALDWAGIPRPSRFAGCGYVPAGETPVTLRRGEDGSAWLAGVARCHSVWACPVCAAAILRERRDQAAAVQRAWRGTETADHAPAITLLTLTVRHAAGDRLEALLGGLMRAWRRLTKGAPWSRFRRRMRLEGTIRRIESTHGRRGWHPHLHVALFHKRHKDPRVQALELAAEMRAEAWLREAWQRAVAAEMGEAHAPDLDVGIDLLDLSAGDAGRYLSKLGLELATITAKAPKRGNRTPWSILASAAASREGSTDRALWAEWTRATKGHRCLEISPRLRALAGLEPDDSDEVSEPDDAADVLTVPSAQWRGWVERDDAGERVRWVPGLRSQPGAVCLLLESIEAGDPAEVQATILDHYARPPPRPEWEDEHATIAAWRPD